MIALPWMKIFIGDEFSEGAHLSAEEYGVWMLLKMAYWQSAGSLPDDDARLARMARLDLHVWQQMRPTIERMFDPGWKSAKLDKYRREAEVEHAKKSAAGKKGADVRWGSRSDTNSNANGEAIGRAKPSANGEADSHQHQMKKDYHAEGTSSRAYTHARDASAHTPASAREEKRRAPTKSDILAAGKRVADQDVFPGSPEFDERRDRILADNFSEDTSKRRGLPKPVAPNAYAAASGRS
jgi:uncharacterized protein YdaU (DUF1376 family)